MARSEASGRKPSAELSALPVSAEGVAAAAAAIEGAVVETAEIAIETRDPQQMETICAKLVAAGLEAELVADDA